MFPRNFIYFAGPGETSSQKPPEADKLKSPEKESKGPGEKSDAIKLDQPPKDPKDNPALRQGSPEDQEAARARFEELMFELNLLKAAMEQNSPEEIRTALQLVAGKLTPGLSTAPGGIISLGTTGPMGSKPDKPSSTIGGGVLYQPNTKAVGIKLNLDHSVVILVKQGDGGVIGQAGIKNSPEAPVEVSARATVIEDKTGIEIGAGGPKGSVSVSKGVSLMGPEGFGANARMGNVMVRFFKPSEKGEPAKVAMIINLPVGGVRFEITDPKKPQPTSISYFIRKDLPSGFSISGSVGTDSERGKSADVKISTTF